MVYVRQIERDEMMSKVAYVTHTPVMDLRSKKTHPRLVTLDHTHIWFSFITASTWHLKGALEVHISS